jgi:MFS family permease
MVLPVWYAAGVLVTFGPELIKSEYGYTIAAASLMVWFNLFLALSDFFSAWISQWLKSRKKVLFGFIALGFAMTAALLLSPYHLTLPVIIALYVGVAFGGGCWVLGVTTAAESFGTNLRATVTTIVPNFSRAATIPMTLGLAALKEHMSLGHATMAVGAVVFTLALLGAALIPETHSKNLDYVEE